MLLDQKSFGSDGSELPKNNRYPWITPCKAFNSPVFEQVFKKKPNYPSSMWNPFSFETQRRVFHNYYESAPLKFHFCISAIKGQTRKCDLFKKLIYFFFDVEVASFLRPPLKFALRLGFSLGLVVFAPEVVSILYGILTKHEMRDMKNGKVKKLYY